MAVERGEMIENVEPVQRDASGTAAGSTAAPSCYRVTVLPGSLEVSARLKNADDLELLLKVLEANRGLFPRVERSATESVVKATKTADRPATDGFAKAVATPPRVLIIGCCNQCDPLKEARPRPYAVGLLVGTCERSAC
jgi:hypothetical protein